MRVSLIAFVAGGLLIGVAFLIFGSQGTGIIADSVRTSNDLDSDSSTFAESLSSPVSPDRVVELENAASSENASRQEGQDSPTVRTATASGGVGAMGIPIPVASEIQSMLEEQPQVRDTHASLEGEDIDPVWGPTAEAVILTALSQRPEIVEQLGTPTVYCRSTMCEIQIVVYDGSANWHTPLANLLRQPWGDDLGFSGVATSAQDGSAAILVFLRRGKPQDSQSQAISTVSI